MAKNMSSKEDRNLPPLPEDTKIVSNSHTEWLKVDSLVIGGYQRIVNPRLVAKIAENFNPNHLRVIDVALRAGKYYVVDGQHRILALRQRGMGDQLVQCNVWLSNSSKEEAHSFDVINTERATVNAYSKYNARLWAGNAIETGVQAMADELKIEIHKSQGRSHGWVVDGQDEYMPLWAVSTVCRYYEIVPEITYRALKLMRTSWDGQARALDSELMAGMITLLCAHGNIDDDKLTRVLGLCTPAEIIDDAWAAKGNRTYTMMAYVAMVLADRYNTKFPRQQISQLMARTYGHAIRQYRLNRSRQGDEQVKPLTNSADFKKLEEGLQGTIKEMRDDT